MLTQGIPLDFRDDVLLFIPSTAIGSAQVYRVTQLRADGIRCRESAGTGPVNLKVAPVTGAAFLGITMDQFYIGLRTVEERLIIFGGVVKEHSRRHFLSALWYGMVRYGIVWYEIIVWEASLWIPSVSLSKDSDFRSIMLVFASK